MATESWTSTLFVTVPSGALCFFLLTYARLPTVDAVLWAAAFTLLLTWVWRTK